MRALITGASSGIGAELAKVYAKNGYDLVLIARSNEKLDSLKNDLMRVHGVDVLVLCIDLSKPNSAENVFSALNHLKIDVLINNAGMGSYGEFYKTDLKKQEDLIMVNILTLCKLTHLYSNKMVEQGGGTIINMASTASFQPGPLMSNYYASKAYVLSFSEALAKELAPHNVRVMAYCPGPTKTEFLEKADVSKKAVERESMKTSKEVALDIFEKAAHSKKTLIVNGKRYKTALFMQRLLPRKLVASTVYKIQKKRKIDE